MINLKSYVTLKEELDSENMQWKYDNWTKKLSDEDKAKLDSFHKEYASTKDVKSFKTALDHSGLDFSALTDAVNDDSKGLPDNIDNIYVLKKIIDTVNINSKQ